MLMENVQGTAWVPCLNRCPYKEKGHLLKVAFFFDGVVGGTRIELVTPAV
jgi:hypothetical protein